MISIKIVLVFLSAFGLTSVTQHGYSNPLNCNNSVTEDSSILKTTNCTNSTSIDDHFHSSFNKHSYTFEESSTIKNQINDILGIKNLLQFRKRNESGFPEKRMVKDSLEVWDSYNNLVRRQYNPVSKNTQDIPSGYNSSLSK